MNRIIAVTMAATAILLCSAVGPHESHAQQKSAAVKLDQSLLDRWLVAIPAVIKLGKSSSVPQSEDDLRPHMERICDEAGFQGYEQCGEVIGYVGMIVSACDSKGTFRDPIVMMRGEIARIEADASLSPQEKDKATETLKEAVARFPGNLPRDHIRLVNANRDRIFEALVSRPE
jgi:hypothetical protein